MNRFRLWCDWSKHCLNHPVYKFLVLIRLKYSPTFTAYGTIKEQMDKYPHYKISFIDEKSEKEKSDINWGWYTVYFLMLLFNGVISRVTHPTVWTWQYWTYAAMMILCFIAGANYKE